MKLCFYFSGDESVTQVCLRGSQVVASLRGLTPKGLGACGVTLTGVSEPRFGIEPRGGHLVVREDVCLPTTSLLELPVAIEYTCPTDAGHLVYPAQHTIRVSCLKTYLY